jgi:predicted Zn-dependent peptidase
VYSISPWVSITPIPRGELTGGAFFVCDPKRAEELIVAVKEEFLKAARGNIDAGVFEKAVEALIKEQEESVQRNLYIAQSYANSAVIYHSPLSRLDKRPSLYRALNRTDLAKAAAELLEGSFVRLVLYPET